MKTVAAITAILAGAFALATVLPAAGEDKPAVTQTEKSAPKRETRKPLSVGEGIRRGASERPPR